MTDQRPDGLFECNTCTRTYDSEISLVFCCAPVPRRRRDEVDDAPTIYRSWD